MKIHRENLRIPKTSLKSANVCFHYNMCSHCLCMYVCMYTIFICIIGSQLFLQCSCSFWASLGVSSESRWSCDQTVVARCSHLRCVLSTSYRQSCTCFSIYTVPVCTVMVVVAEQVSRVAQWERAGPITQRSMDRNHPLLAFFTFFYIYHF